MDISVVIVNWNTLSLLEKCLSSVRETASNAVKEVIVVDNASTDGSPEMVSAKFPEVTLIRSATNLGFARANNLGITKATGSLIALVNSDVVVHPHCFQRLGKFLSDYADVGLVGPKVHGGDGLLQRSCRRLPTVWNLACQVFGLDRLLSRFSLFSGREMLHWDHLSQREVQVLSGCFWVAKRNAVEEVGGLDEAFFFYAEDVDWCKRFRDAGWKLMFVPEATATHFGGGSTAKAPVRYSIEMLKANLVYWKKHHGQLGKSIYRSLWIFYHTIRLSVLAIMKGLCLGDAENVKFKFKENFYCLRWLLTGKGAL